MAKNDIFYPSAVTFRPLPDPGLEFSEEVIRKCGSCYKRTRVCESGSDMARRLGGIDGFYCSFCLRHELHTRKRFHYLGMSFRSIFGYFYHHNHVSLPSYDPKKMWIPDIKEFISAHVEVGSDHPLFCYDPETYLWFVDFSRVGDSRRKVPAQTVLRTVVNILACFNTPDTMPAVRQQGIYKKYADAINLFYSHRRRPKNRKLLIPTVPLPSGIKKTRDFLPSDLVQKI